MKITKEIPEKNIIKVVPENLDDLWHLSNIILRNNAISALTERRTEDKGDKIRADRGAKKRVYLGIKAEKINFDENTNRLRITGPIIHGPDDVPIGAYHTIDIEPLKEVSIQKNWKKWDLQRLQEAIESSKKPKIAVVILDEGEANIFIIQDYGVKEIGHIKSTLSKKLDYKQQNSEIISYFNEIANLIESYNSKIIVAGPGFTKNNFQKYISEKRKDLTQKVVFESTNHTGKLGLAELLKSGVIDRVYGEARLSKESQLVNKLLEEISKKGLAVYGINEVNNALNYSAIETLLITDEYARKNRNKIENIINNVESIGGKYHILSTEYDAGKQLKALGGIGGLLRFPIE